MAGAPRVVAELGRPETPAETAARKAESSRVYRSSQTFRNLIAALIVTVAVVAVVYFGVPRGTPPQPEPVDVAAAAEATAASLGRPVLVPDVPDSWRANMASRDEGAWVVVYAPPSGFVRIAQGLEVDETWPSTVLGGYAPTGSTVIDGVEWDVYDLPGDGGIRYALAADAGTDTVLIYGSMTAATAEVAAAGVADQVRAIAEETP